MTDLVACRLCHSTVWRAEYAQPVVQLVQVVLNDVGAPAVEEWVRDPEPRDDGLVDDERITGFYCAGCGTFLVGQTLRAAVPLAGAVGKTVAYVEQIAPPDENGDHGSSSLRFTDGATLYVDSPTLYVTEGAPDAPVD